MPCEPANLTATIQCGNSSSASLSWVGSIGAVAYMGLAQSETGSTVYCETTHTSCNLEGLVCGTVYNFTVQATGGFCNSSLSEPQTKGAGTTIISHPHITIICFIWTDLLVFDMSAKGVSNYCFWSGLESVWEHLVQFIGTFSLLVCLPKESHPNLLENEGLENSSSPLLYGC